jgi:hypothetical protein
MVAETVDTNIISQRLRTPKSMADTLGPQELQEG